MQTTIFSARPRIQRNKVKGAASSQCMAWHGMAHGMGTKKVNFDRYVTYILARGPPLLLFLLLIHIHIHASFFVSAPLKPGFLIPSLCRVFLFSFVFILFLVPFFVPSY
ncbi:hypothetical protein QBC43DRAFT_307767 [Cladorrhinum sp. PSN259]|nr:hypothetical protein QBC43DRAFT_307767 [Cladorrhinum sp. PSN259]